MSQAITLSLGEVDVAIKKAHRGAGYPWGLAEEAGRGARWLVSRNILVLPPILDALKKLDDDTPNLQVQVNSIEDLQISDSVLAGASIADRLQGLQGPLLVRGVILSPLLLGIVGVASEALALQVDVSWTSGGAIVRKDGISFRGSAPDLRKTDVTVKPVGVSSNHGGNSQMVVEVPIEIWSGLERFAHRTYVPATAASRELGAGAGLSDND